MTSDAKPSNAFVTARKGFCYLTIKAFGRNHEMMRIRAYKIEPGEKRDMRRLYLDVVFDWKKITQQLAEKREACRQYRTRTRYSLERKSRADHDMLVVYDPSSRTIFTDGIPSTAGGVGRLLDAVLRLDRPSVQAPPARARSRAKSKLTLVQSGRFSGSKSCEG